jgi:hypothetical protein
VERETRARPMTRAEAFAADVRPGVVDQAAVPARGADRVAVWCRLASGERVLVYEPVGQLLERRIQIFRGPVSDPPAP